MTAGRRGRRPRLRVRHLAAVAAPLLAGLYALGVLLFVHGDPLVDEIGDPVPDSGLLVAVQPLEVDAAGGFVRVKLVCLPVGGYAAEGSQVMARTVVVAVALAAERTSVRLEAGSPAGAVDVTLLVDNTSGTGTPTLYPFDSYQAPLLLEVAAPAEGGLAAARVPVAVLGEDGLQGWRTRLSRGTTDTLALPAVLVELQRSEFVRGFALLLLGAMVVLAALAVAVAAAVARRRRGLEATLASWFAAMLFALVPLRSFLPGAPPPGALVDVLVLFWVTAVLVASLATFTVTWLRTGPPGERSRPPRNRGGPGPVDP